MTINWKLVAKELSNSIEINYELIDYTLYNALPQEIYKKIVNIINKLTNQHSDRQKAFNVVQMRKNNYLRIN